MQSRVRPRAARGPAAGHPSGRSRTRCKIFDHRPSTIGHRPSTIYHRPPTTDFRPSTFDLRPSTIDLRLPTINHRRARPPQEHPASTSRAVGQPEGHREGRLGEWPPWACGPVSLGSVRPGTYVFFPEGGTSVLAHTSSWSSGRVPTATVGKPKCAFYRFAPSFVCITPRTHIPCASLLFR